MLLFRNLLNFVGVAMLMLMACSVFGLEVEEGKRDLIGLGEGAEGSPSPLLNPTLTITHFANEFICLPPLSANSRREEKEEENYREEKEGKKE